MKPSLDEVIEYASKRISYHLIRVPNSVPAELKEEMQQDAMVRVIEAYPKLDADKGWKAFVELHCQGAVKDYLKSGKGFIEHKKSRFKIAEGEDTPREIMKHRVDVVNDDGDRLDAGEVLGINGISSEDTDELDHKIKWDLVSRMARVDHTIHLLAKVLLDFDIAELSNTFGVTRERLSQRYHAFLAEMRSPLSARDPWLNQAMYAFGIGDEISDNGLGYDHDPIDLYSLAPIEKDYGIHKSALEWVKDLFPDILSVKEADINWDMVSRLSRYDESLHMMASILLGKTQREICEYFDIGVNAARKKVHRFIDKLDSPDFYEDRWVKQVIQALGLNLFFGQKYEKDVYGLLSDPIDLGDFSIPRASYDRGEQLTLTVISGDKLKDGSEEKRTRKLRKIIGDRDSHSSVCEEVQTSIFELMTSCPLGTSLH